MVKTTAWIVPKVFIVQILELILRLFVGGESTALKVYPLKLIALQVLLIPLKGYGLKVNVWNVKEVNTACQVLTLRLLVIPDTIALSQLQVRSKTSAQLALIVPQGVITLYHALQESIARLKEWAQPRRIATLVTTVFSVLKWEIQLI